MEIFQNSHAILLDGAHSPPKMEALAEGLRALYTDRERVIGVLSFSQGPQCRGYAGSYICHLLDTVILTEFDVVTDYGNKRAQDPNAVAVLVRGTQPFHPMCFLNWIRLRAIEMARRLAGAKDMICVTGSIFLVGEIRKYLTLSRSNPCIQSYKSKILSDFVKLVVVKAPLVARKARPGQFVIVRIDEKGERIPLTIADLDAKEGTITLIFQEVGKSTKQMGLLEVGDALKM